MMKSVLLQSAVLLVLTVFCLVLCSEGVQVANAQSASILFLPLDERFTTRDAFLNLAKTTPFEIVTPPTSLLPHLKIPAPIKELHAWMDAHINDADALIISSEMYLYGGLIASRSSNDSESVIQQRLAKLVDYKKKNPNLKMYLSSVVMRIPAYNSDFEEPWYWADYGFDLYSYSYFLDAYNVTHNASDLALAKSFEAKVPPAIVKEFIWRRKRNFDILKTLVELQKSFPSQNGGVQLFERLYITLDDNAKYGFNIEEANALRAMVSNLQLESSIYIYPGADEVGLTMLSTMSVATVNKPKAPAFYLVFRDIKTINYIPNYEGQPMVETLEQQIKAAGGAIVNPPPSSKNCEFKGIPYAVSPDDADIILLVNNFSSQKQKEAPDQPSNGSIAEYDIFTPYLAYAKKGKVLGFADNRYSNGADNYLIEYMKYQHLNGTYKLNMQNFAYAGWNTDGNTLGTVISNCVLLHLFNKQQANTFFNALRILEDEYYQAMLRQELAAYVEQVIGDSVNNLATDLNFYERYVWKVLMSDLERIDAVYDLPWKLEKAYFPWNRTFEIGFVAN